MRKPKVGELVWFELPVDDFERAKGFYGELLGWKFKPHTSEGEDYLMIDSAGGDEDVVAGGFYRRKGPRPQGEGVTLYFAVEDLDRTLERAERMGGSIAKRKSMISPEYGFYGQAFDTEGNLISFWSEK